MRLAENPSNLKTDVVRRLQASMPGKHKDISAVQLSNFSFICVHEMVQQMRKALG